MRSSNITIPAAGVKKRISLTGRSLIVESMSVYQDAGKVPTFRFIRSGVRYPLYPRSTYQNPGEDFDGIEITGTAESAGDDLRIITVPDCLPTQINIQFNQTRRAGVGTTFTKQMDDSVQSFTDPELVSSEGDLPTKIYIACAPLTAGESGIKYAYNVDPSQGKESIGFYLSDNDSPLEVVGYEWIAALRFINAESGEAPILNVQPEY